MSATSVVVSVGAKAAVKVKDASGTVKAESGDKSIATATYGSSTVTITGVKAGATKVKVSDRSRSVSIAVTVSGSAPHRATLDRRVARPGVE